jgi:hypothetical protein
MANMDLVIANSSLPLRWQGKDYLITQAGIKNGVPYANVEPSNPALTSELNRRIKKDLGLIVYLCDGYCCFVEDYVPVKN